MPKRKASCKRKTFEVNVPSSDGSIEDEDLICEDYNSKSFIVSPSKDISDNECNSDYQGTADKDTPTAYMNSDFGNEINTMLEKFGTEMNKSLMVKRRRMENFVETAVESNQNKLSEVWSAQHRSIKTAMERFGHSMNDVLNKWDEDISRQKVQTEKVFSILKQFMITQQQVRASNLKRLSSLRSAYELYSKNMQDLESKHTKENAAMNEEMKTELKMLQKKILLESQEQELLNARKSVQAMLFN